MSHDACVSMNFWVDLDVWAVSPSRSKMSLFPRRCRFNCLRYSMISGDFTAFGRIIAKMAGDFFARGSVTIVATADRFFHPPAETMMGVLPFFAHVFLTFGRSLNPASSKKPNHAPMRSPFLDAGKCVTHPLSDVFFIPFSRPRLRFLGSPAKISKDFPDMTRVI